METLLQAQEQAKGKKLTVKFVKSVQRATKAEGRSAATRGADKLKGQDAPDHAAEKSVDEVFGMLNDVEEIRNAVLAEIAKFRERYSADQRRKTSDGVGCRPRFLRQFEPATRRAPNSARPRNEGHAGLAAAYGAWKRGPGRSTFTPTPRSPNRTEHLWDTIINLDVIAGRDATG